MGASAPPPNTREVGTRVGSGQFSILGAVEDLMFHALCWIYWMELSRAVAVEMDGGGKFRDTVTPHDV